MNDPGYGSDGDVHDDGDADDGVLLSQTQRIRRETCDGGDHDDHSSMVWASWTGLVCCVRTRYGLQDRNVTVL